MLMPSIEGKEIEVALANGFKEHNLHIVDRNPAIVATLKRRFPLVKTYGVDIIHALLRAKKSGIRFDAVNLDLCGCLSRNLGVALLAASGILKPEGMICLTILRGREKAGMLEWAGRAIKEFNAWASYIGRIPAKWQNLGTDLARLLWIVHVLSVGERHQAIYRWMPHLKATGKYKSSAGTQTMRWAMWQVKTPLYEASIEDLHPVAFDFFEMEYEIRHSKRAA